MGILSFLNPIQSNLTAILGGALALSLVGNVGLGLYSVHEAKIGASDVTATKAVNAAATVHKQIVENRDNALVQTTQAGTTATIAADIASLRSKSRIIYLPAATPGTKGIDGPSEGTVVPAEPDTTATSRPTELVPLSQRDETDREICVQNTDLVKAWQKFYSDQLTIQKEESLGTTSSGNNGSGTGVLP